jgi:Zn-dependent peptidase ImmA (M78 family)/transcriptional regulator with XRE-family HTH domain
MYGAIYMPRHATQRNKIPFNPEVMRWAREFARSTYEEAANAAGVSPEKIEEWESGASSPTVRQGRAIAELYERPFLEFFALSAPNIQHSMDVPDFRMNSSGDYSSDNRGLASIQSWAETQRLNAIDLHDILGEIVSSTPRNLAVNEFDNPEDAAARARTALEISPQAQFGLNIQRRDQFPKYLRAAFEASGILVLKNSALKHHGARGMCIYLDPMPVIIFGDEQPGGQVFTLAHELAHIALQQSAVSGGIVPKAAKGEAASIERWCNRFAGSFLMPADMVRRAIGSIGNISDGIDEGTLKSIADWFAVSRHAMLIRLVELGEVASEFYWGKMRQKFTEEEAAFKSFGRPKYYGSRFRTSNGDMYVSLVLEAWSTGKITNHNAGEFLGIKNQKHLFDVRSNFGM